MLFRSNNRNPGTKDGVTSLPPNTNHGVPNQYGNRPGQYGASIPVDQTTSYGYRPPNQQYENGQSRVPAAPQQQPNREQQYGNNANNNYNRNPTAPQGNYDNSQYDANNYGGAGGANRPSPLIDVRTGPTKPSSASTPEAQKSNTPAWSFFEPENSNVKG